MDPSEVPHTPRPASARPLTLPSWKRPRRHRCPRGNIFQRHGRQLPAYAGTSLGSILGSISWRRLCDRGDPHQARAGFRLKTLARLSPEKNPEKEKGPLALAQYGDKLFCYRPDPNVPGGWGLRNPVSRGPGQRKLLLSQFSRAVGGRKLGGIMIPLTILLRPGSAIASVFPLDNGNWQSGQSGIPPAPLLRRRPVGAIMSLTA